MKTRKIQSLIKKLTLTAALAAAILAAAPESISASATQPGTVETPAAATQTDLNKVVLAKKKAALYAGEYTTIKVKKLPGTSRKFVKFSSDKKKIAEVNADGEVTAKKKGSATVTVTSKTNKNASAKFRLTVKAKPKKSSLALGVKKLSVNVGKTAKIRVKKLSGVSSRQVLYTSSNPAVASVNAKGTVTGISAGKTTITATSAVNKKVKAKCTVTVSQKVTELQVPQSITLEPTRGMMVNVNVLPGAAKNKNITASSADTSVAIANAEDGARVAILGIAEGKTTVTVASANGKVRADISVTVKKKIVRVKELQLHEVNPGYGYARELPVGGTAAVALQTTVLPANATNKSLYFYSDNTSIATVDQKGFVTGVGAGYCKVYATTCDGSDITQSCEIYITAAPIMSEKEVYAYLREHPEVKYMYVAMSPEMFAELQASMEARGYNKDWIASHEYEERDGWYYILGQYGDHRFDAESADGTKVYSYPELWYWDLTPRHLAINIWEEE